MKAVIYRAIMSQNGRDRMSYHAHGRDRDAWYWYLRQKYGPREKPTSKRTVKITSFRLQACDLPNLTGGAKGLIDAMRMANLIHDDSPKWVEIVWDQVLVRTKEAQRTEIEVSE